MAAYWQASPWSSNDEHAAKRGRFNDAQPTDSTTSACWKDSFVADQLKRNGQSEWTRIAEQKKWNASNAAQDAQNSLPAIDWATQARKPFRREFVPYGYVDLEEARFLRNSVGITIEHDPSGEHSTPKPIQNFHEISALPQWALKGLADNKWDTPTAIQAQALPIAVAGRDLIGIAQTGSGKTAAFLLPALINIEAQEPLTRTEPGPVALVLAPTRELAVQISDEALKLVKHSWESAAHPKGMRSVVFYGGGRKSDQLKDSTWEGSHIVVATPGRLIDFLAQGDVSLHRVTYFVLDEADRMLDMGFAGDVRNIASQVRPERQAMFFSATWSAEVQSLARDFCSQDPVRIRAGLSRSPDNRNAGNGDGRNKEEDADPEDDNVLSAREGITQQVIVIDNDPDWQNRAEEKRRLLDAHMRQTVRASKDNKVLVFVNEKGFADELVTKLCEDGFQADAIHGGRKQALRLWALDEFRKSNVRLLVATDVLGRGIDIPDVSHVVVYDMGSIEGYIHRIGRTGRGKEAKGHALVFFEYYWKFPQNAAKLADVLQRCNQPVPPDLIRIAQEVVDGKRDICDEWGKRIPVGQTKSVYKNKGNQW